MRQRIRVEVDVVIESPHDLLSDSAFRASLEKVAQTELVKHGQILEAGPVSITALSKFVEQRYALDGS